MKPNVRACVAYLVGRIISGRRSSSIYDFSQSKHIAMTGKMSESRVSIYDHERGCHFGGKINTARCSLYDYGERHHISLEIRESKFKGYDYGNASHFSGSVRGRT